MTDYQDITILLMFVIILQLGAVLAGNDAVEIKVGLVLGSALVAAIAIFIWLPI